MHLALTVGKQQNIGASLDVDLIGGSGSSLSLNGGKTNLSSDYAAVNEQAIIATQTSDLVVGGKGEFIGGALTTASPEDNKTVFKQGIETQDIINHSRYEGDSIQAGISIGSTNGKPQGGMNGMGYGTDGDDQTSTTRASVTGMAGKSEATTGTRDILNEPLVNSFDVARVTEELGAQTQITKEFGKEAPKAVAEFAQNRINAIKKDPTLTMDEKLAEIKKWDEGGVYRVAAHTSVGAFGTGTLEGALTTGGVAAAAPVISDLEQKMADKLVEQGMSADIAKSTANAITSVAIVGAGTAAGLDASSTGMAANVDANNRQLHPQEKVLADILFRKAKKEGWKRADGKPYTLQEIEDALRWANSTKYGEQWTSKRTVKIHKNASKDGINKAMYDHGIASDFDSRLWKITSTGEYTTITQNFNNIEKPDTNLVNFIKGETKSYGYSWTSGVPQPYNAKTAGPTSKPKPTTTAQIIPQRSLDNKNQAIINNNGSIDSGSLPAAPQQANQKTFDAAVMVVDAVGLATGAGEVVIAVKWAGKKTIQYVVKKSALDAAKQGTTSVDDLIKVSKPYTGSISNSQRGSTGIAKPDKIDNVISENRSYQGIYDPKEVRTDLEAVYGQNNVTSTTIPKKPHQASATRDDVIIDANGNRAVQITMDDGSIKNIPYDNRGLPIFDDVSVFTAKIDHSKSYTGQMKQASKDMWESIKDDPVAKSKFTERQLNSISAGKANIPGYTWHHNAQSSPNNMQLVPMDMHSNKTMAHTGQNSLKEGK